MFKRLERDPHPHLVNILATFSRKGLDHILLPWADSNLWLFWRTEDGPLTTTSKTIREDGMLWVSRQMTGIASALATLHKADVRHGDIKPDNVLYFGSSAGAGKNLVLTDFGLSSHHREVTEVRERTTRKRKQHTGIGAVTLVYRAPESDMRDRDIRSRAYDIWGLGCLFLEMAAWTLGELKGLQMARINRDVEEPFFETEPAAPTAKGEHVFRVKKSVTKVGRVLTLLPVSPIACLSCYTCLDQALTFC